MAARLGPEAKAGGRLCEMRHSIGTEVRGYFEGRTVIDETPVLGSDEESVSQIEVCRHRRTLHGFGSKRLT